MKYQRRIGDPRRNYGKEWKRWRLKHKMTQIEFSLASGICRRSVQKIELGEHRPHLKSRMKFKALQERYEKEQQWQQQSKFLSL